MRTEKELKAKEGWSLKKRSGGSLRESAAFVGGF